MKYETINLNQDNIKNKIHAIRGHQVLIDEDLAKIYGVETRTLNRAVKRNVERFPEEFMFQLTEQEYTLLISQSGTSSWGGRRKLPLAFTEQGVAMLSGVLKSDTAIRISIQIISAFVSMRNFISKNAEVFHRLDRVEIKQIEHDYKFDEIFDAIQSKDIKPKQGIFFNGEVFDAYKFVSDLVRSAKYSISIIDNYVDDSVLTLLSKCQKNVNVIIYTNNISKQLILDVEKYNTQYNPIILKEFNQSHDRFLIIDNKEVYHFGASLKDLGKKWFAFSKFDKEAFKILDKLGLK